MAIATPAIVVIISQATIAMAVRVDAQHAMVAAMATATHVILSDITRQAAIAMAAIILVTPAMEVLPADVHHVQVDAIYEQAHVPLPANHIIM